MSLSHGLIHNLLEFLLLGVLGVALGLSLVSKGDEVVKDGLEFGGSLFGLGDFVVKTSKVVVTLGLESAVVGIVFLLVSDVSVLNLVKEVEESLKRLTVLEFNSDGVDQSLTQLSVGNGLDLFHTSGEGRESEHSY